MSKHPNLTALGLARKGLRHKKNAFTLIEIMVAAAILSLILYVIFGITQQISNAWKKSNAKIEAFQGARAGFGIITRQLSQATLNTYYDYYDTNGKPRSASSPATFVPSQYGRYSDLHFICGKNLVDNQVGHAVFFQAPMGRAGDSTYTDMESLLNACGFFVGYGDDPARPDFLDTLASTSAQKKYRYRLMQFLQPSEKLGIYKYNPTTDPYKWFTEPLGVGDPLLNTSAPIRQICDNILTVLFLPREASSDQGLGPSLTDDYEYDTRKAQGSPGFNPLIYNQLPPVMELVMVAIDEPSAIRLGNTQAAPTTELGMDLLFQDSSKLDEDLEALTNTLNKKAMTSRIFRTVVALRSSKWSSK